MNKNTIIFDLDGTLANIDARRELATKPNGKLDWDVFFDASNISLDVPNEPVVKMAQMFAENDFNVVIFSGRNDRSFSLVNTPGEIICSAILFFYFICFFDWLVPI